MTSVKNKARHPALERDFEKATRLRDAGKLSEAAAVLVSLADRYPEDAPVHGMLGHVYDGLGKTREAAASFRRATDLAPRSELASISLFHALYELGDLDAAFAEMRRFKRTQRPSPEYDLLINDLKEELPPEE